MDDQNGEPEPGTADASGAIYWPGDDESHRAPGSALVLLVVSFVGGGLYLWWYSRLLAGFDWLAALSLRSSALLVVGGVVMILGAILLIRHGLVWASRLGALLCIAPPARLLVATLVDGGDGGAAAIRFLVEAGAALIVLAVSFSPALRRWRRRRQQVVKAAARRRTPTTRAD